MTVKYRDDFVFTTAHSTQLYYGVSIAGWRNFFASHNYKFVTVDRNGVNSFFVDPEYFSSEFLGNIKKLEIAENRYQLTKFRIPSNEQFSLIESQKFIPIEKCS